MSLRLTCPSSRVGVTVSSIAPFIMKPSNAIPVSTLTAPGTMKAARQPERSMSDPATTPARAVPSDPKMPLKPSTLPRRLPAFVAQRLGKARTRTYGRVSSTEAGLSFTYRPWLILPRRTMVLPEGSYVLGRGLVCPVVRLGQSDGDGVNVLGVSLEVRINNSLRPGCAGYSAGFAHSGELVGGQWVEIHKAAGWRRKTPQIIGSDAGGGDA